MMRAVFLIAIVWCAFVLLSLAGCTTNVVQPDSPPVESVPVGPVPAIPGFKPEWGVAAISAIKAQLANLNKASKDMARFCPKYGQMNIDQQALAWGYLISGIVKFESDYNPKSAMTESNGDVSQGLFQLTYGNAHCPKSKSEADLNDPAVNIKCAVQIMGDETRTDGVVAAGGYTKFGAPPAKGLARYWSVMRVPDSNAKHRLAAIIALAKGSPGCL